MAYLVKKVSPMKVFVKLLKGDDVYAIIKKLNVLRPGSPFEPPNNTGFV